MAYDSETLNSFTRFRDAFTGFMSKDVDPPSHTFAGSDVSYLDPDTNTWTTTFTVYWDLTPGSWVLPVRTVTPQASLNVEPQLRIYDESDNLLATDDSSSAGGRGVQTAEDWIELLQGDPLAIARLNDGEVPAKVAIAAQNFGSSETNDFGEYKFRGVVFPQGGGSAIL